MSDSGIEMGRTPPRIVEEMKEYYEARAPEYDEWFLRKGRYDHGPEANARWVSDVEQVRELLDRFRLECDVAELACGTGNWTSLLVRHAQSVTAVDASPQMIEINRKKVADSKVDYVEHDIFDWKPGRLFDGLFFGFWISHVPLERMDAFLRQSAGLLEPGGKIFFVDSRPDATMSASNHLLPAEGSQVMTRKLNDGREFEIVKNFFEPASLAARCARAGLRVQVIETDRYFILGQGRRGE